MTNAARPAPQILAFGTFELDVRTGELRKEGRLIHLRHQPVRVIRLLLERAGTLVTRKEIISALWPDDLDVDVEQGLNHCVKEIRAALGDRTDSPRFVQTLPRRGYRFLGEVRGLRTREDRGSVDGAPAGLNSHSATVGSALTSADSTVRDARPAPGPWSGAGAGDASEAPSADRGARVRVKVTLTRVADDALLWSETYERRAGEVERLERDLAVGIRSGMQAATALAREGAPVESDPDAPRRDQRFE